MPEKGLEEIETSYEYGYDWQALSCQCILECQSNRLSDLADSD
jgi:hypothetical protein